MKPTEVPVPFKHLKPYVRYQFVIDAANIVKTLNLELVNRQASEMWPVMLKNAEDDYIWVTEEECRQIRLVCPECDSAFFEKNPLTAICNDCGHEVTPDEYLERTVEVD